MCAYRQLQDHTAVGNDRYNGMVDCFKKIIKQEGLVVYPTILAGPRAQRV